ncbi:MAG TPA: methyltransferase domain-containing protein [Pseudonocardiaceae bacterium]|jgi:SAM-dependent methyltransferase
MDDQADAFARRASSFGSQAAAYAEYRPDYPVALLEWALAPVRDADDLRVLDLAAGTGKLTEGLLGQGLDVVAVEPDTAMLAQLTSKFPTVTAKSGTAEAIPLPDASVNAVFAAQALHWFDLTRALPEIDRVLRPGGPLVAVWNTYDDRTPWVADLCAITDAVKRSDHYPAPDPQLEAFGVVEENLFPHQITRTVDTLVATMATMSYVLVSPPDRKARILARMRDLLLANPATATGEFSVPITTFAMRVTPS